MNYSNILEKFDKKHSNSLMNYPKIRIGAILQLGIRIQEGEKFRIQKYKGMVIARKNNPYTPSIRVRKIFQKIGVERIFPLQSNQLDFINVLKKHKIRRSKLYFLRNRFGKNSLIKE